MNDAKPDSLEEAQTAYEEIMESEDAEELLEELKESLHYTLDPDMTYVSILKDAKTMHLIERNYRQHLIGLKSLMNCFMDFLRM